MVFPKRETRRKWAAFVGFKILMIHALVSCIALNFLVSSLLMGIFGNEGDAERTLSYNFKTVDTAFPTMDPISAAEESKLWFCAMVTFTVIGVCTSFLQMHGSKSLILSTYKNLKASQALELLHTHQWIQQVFLFLEVVLFMVSVYSPIFARCVEFIGSENLVMSAFFRGVCLYIVDLFRDELEETAELEVEQKEEINKKGAIIEKTIIQDEAKQKV
ncbi:unnamed protein product [Orchesella dallaii]|uniref:Uncharacterized protein n=1 Tax=Orchesella dallaii TaxID=48710 RepID=A0ABP1RUM3_9HEXA